MEFKPRYNFSEGEKVLCTYGPLLYDAKCIKAERFGTRTKYLIHYSGWNKRHDGWVTEERLLKYNDENIAKQKELAKQHMKDKKNKSKGKKEKSETHIGYETNVKSGINVTKTEEE